MEKKKYLSFAEEVIENRRPEGEIYKEILNTPDREIVGLLNGADLIRNRFFGDEVHLCTICNGKSGRCSEDCRFCAQSGFYTTDAPVFPLMDEAGLREGGLRAAETPINRYAIVTTGRGLPGKEVRVVAEALEKISGPIGKCASLGVLNEKDLAMLRSSGVTRYHHNLETSRSYFSEVCTTHSYDERVQTILRAKKLGMQICSGGIFGIGETDAQILELALDLRELDVNAVPINFLLPIKGTPYEAISRLTPLKCLKIIALFRYVLPDKEIIICGGRVQNLQDLHPMVFYAGASAIMTGNYLTREGRTLEKDLEMIEWLGLKTRKKC
ncbi:MAG TPA: biotin synthase BioB [Thermodesulfobacteriota bacterium]|nr:biotin synthase BioB [Thermodesulfobacteriota bacterium]